MINLISDSKNKNNKKQFFLSFIFSFLLLSSFLNYSKSQNIGIGTTSPNSSAKLDVQSNNSGFLPPRLTYTQRNTIQNPASGLIIFCTDCKTTFGEMQYYNGQEWISMAMGSASMPILEPSISLNFISSINHNSANITSTINNDGGSEVYMRGVCWSRDPNPTTSLLTITQDGYGIGTFNSVISDLIPNTQYHVRSYATNIIGTTYSNDTVITTSPISIPTISSSIISNLQTNPVTFLTNIADDGGSAVIFRGVCWSNSPNPTISLATKTLDGTGIGQYSSLISGLTPNTYYYFRAYATNSVGTAYGPELVYNTPLKFNKKILIENCTGAWGGYNTRMTYSLETFQSTHPNCIVTSIHGGGGGSDPYKFQYFTNYNTAFGVQGYPTGILNRKGEWSESTADLDNALSGTAPLGIKIISALNNQTISGSVSVKFGAIFNNPLKIVIALVENGLVYPQVNYYSQDYGLTPYLYGGVSPVNNFVHNGVLRNTYTNLLGDNIPSSYQSSYGTYELPFNFSLTGNTYGGGSYTAVAANTAIVAFVLDATTNSTIGIYNVQYAPVGATVNYELLP
jgi:hypothetical protein